MVPALRSRHVLMNGVPATTSVPSGIVTSATHAASSTSGAVPSPHVSAGALPFCAVQKLIGPPQSPANGSSAAPE